MFFLKNKRRVLQNAILYGESKSQHDWLLCRKIIVFTGSLLSIIYGLAILTATQWLKVESNKLSEPLPLLNTKLIKNYFSISSVIVVIGLIGCISPFIKSIQIKSTKKICESNNNKTTNRVKSFIKNEESIQGSRFLSSSLSQIYDSVPNWIKISPLFSFNAISIATIIPIELKITVNTFKSLAESNDSINCFLKCAKVQEEIHRLYLCLITLYFSVIMIQFCVFLYIIDLLYSHLKDKSFQRKMSPYLRSSMKNKTESPLAIYRPRSEQKRRLQSEKNLQFFQFLHKEKQLTETPRRSPDLRRHASEASTIEAYRVFPRQSTSSDHNEYTGPQTPVHFEV